MNQEQVPIPKAVVTHQNLVDDWMGELQASKTAPKTIIQAVAAVKCLYKRNGITLNIEPIENTRVVYRDKASTQDQLVKLLDVADLREKVIISTLALAGVREGTLTRLQYHHIQEDFEKGIVPIHMHIESDITKGKYVDFDTFIGAEAVQYLKLYFHQRRMGEVKGNELRIPPEEIRPESPLILHAFKFKPISMDAVKNVVHGLLAKAGLITLDRSTRRYPYRGHSLRKFFKTQMEARGVKTDYVEYMM